MYALCKTENQYTMEKVSLALHDAYLEYCFGVTLVEIEMEINSPLIYTLCSNWLGLLASSFASIQHSSAQSVFRLHAWMIFSGKI